MLDQMGGADAARRMIAEQAGSAAAQRAMMDAMTTGARLSLAGLDEADVRALTAFYESDAARYVHRAVALGTANALAPRLAEVAASPFGVAAPPPAPPQTGVRYETVDIDDAPFLAELGAIRDRVVASDAARAVGVGGTVVLRLVIDEGGVVESAEVARSPDPRLSALVLDAVRGVRFTPHVLYGTPTRTPITYPFAFGGRPAPPADGVFELADTLPTPEGGLEGLQRRLEYPPSARDDGVEGVVVVQFVVDEGGAVTDAEVVRSPDPRLSEAALRAVRASRFTPGGQGERPVKVRMALPLTFRLR